MTTRGHGFGSKAESTAATVPVEWYTPAWIFDKLGLEFDLDPCSPEEGPVPWVPAKRFVTERENGLLADWSGLVWLNPPYGRLTGPFLRRLEEHGNGVALVFARPDTAWAQRALAKCDAVCFVSGRIGFVRKGETDVRNSDRQSGGAGSMLLAWGGVAASAVRRSGLGVTFGRAA